MAMTLTILSSKYFCHNWLTTIWNIKSIWWIVFEIFEIFESFYLVDYLLWVLSPAACASNPLISPYHLIIITAIYIPLLDIIIFGFYSFPYILDQNTVYA